VKELPPPLKTPLSINLIPRRVLQYADLPDNAEHQEEIRRSSAISLRGVLINEALDSTGAPIRDAIVVYRSTRRGIVKINVNPSEKTRASWTQTEITTKAITRNRYTLQISPDGNTEGKVRTLDKEENELPLLSQHVRIGRLIIGSRYPRTDFDEIDRIRRFNPEPQTFMPSTGFMDSFRRDVLDSLPLRPNVQASGGKLIYLADSLPSRDFDEVKQAV
jgi:hypothetical protein